jgi:hypothetical protein
MDFNKGILTDTVICAECVKVVRTALAERKDGVVESGVAETDAAYSEHEAEIDAVKQQELEAQADQARFEAKQAEGQGTEEDSVPMTDEEIAAEKERIENSQNYGTPDSDAQDSAPIPADRDTSLDAAPAQEAAPAAPQPMSNRAKKRAQAAVAKVEGDSAETSSDA